MIALFIITCLITFLVVILSSVAYLISVIIDESDDNDHSSSPLLRCSNAHDTPIDAVNKRNETALHMAIRKQKLQTLIDLLNCDANVECRNAKGETPLIVACKVNNVFAVQLLLIFDADYNATDDLGLSARHWAAEICDKNKNQQLVPSAANLILAMLNAMGAKRCHLVQNHDEWQTSECRDSVPPKKESTGLEGGSDEGTNIVCPKNGVRAKTPNSCTEGCSSSGTYNGNSYNKWPNYSRESLYKRHLFSDLVEERRKMIRSIANRCICQLRAALVDEQPRSRLLCIDGGGLRGVIVCQIMIELERYLSKPMVSYFDWVGGTSVGAFIACALCRGVPLHELRRICFDVKDEVFSGGRPYNSKFIEHVLKRTYGATTRMSYVKDRKLAVTSVLADRDPCQLKFFRNYRSAAKMLDMYGFPHDLYNSTSGHSFVTSSNKRASRRMTNQQQAKAQRSSTTSAARIATTSSTIQTRLASTNKSASDSDDTTLNQRKVMSSDTYRTIKSEKSADITSSTSKRSGSGASSPGEAETVLDENDQDPLMWQAVRASAAAPFFFKPYGPFLDGGIISNNPTIDMLNEFFSYQKVREFLRKHHRNGINKAETDRNSTLYLERSRKLDLVVSLGTGRGRVIGREAIADFGQIASGFSAVFSPKELVRSIRAARDLFKRLMQQSCHTDDHILDRAQAWCSSIQVPYFRINPPLVAIFSIDDKRDEQLINALWQTKLYMKSMKHQLVELAELLEDPRCQIESTSFDASNKAES